jgi:cellulose synthase (UDP-forming)
MMRLIRSLGIILCFILCLCLNGLLLYHYNTLTWPYLWPQPAVYILIAIAVTFLWLPELLQGTWALRFIGLVMIFVGQSYTLHTLAITWEHPSLVALIHAVGITGTFIIMTISYVNQMLPKVNREAAPLPDDLPHVAAVIPTYGEPVDILTNTARSLIELDYPKDKLHVIVSDDGHRDEVRRMAERLGIHYNKGAKKDAKAGNLNSALGFIDQHFPQARLILTQDADEIIDPTFLQKTVGYFEDDKIALVQTPKEAVAPGGDPFGVRDRVFYDVIQPGRNGSGAAFSCGSGVLWRISAVREVGGYATWNVVEDLTTSYLLHCAGYRSEYYNEILSVGLAPDDIPGLLKQRGTWAVDNWRLFLFKNPLFQRGLTPRQRLQYMELGLFYVNTTFFLPMLMLTPLLSLLTGTFVPIEGAALFPWIVFSLLFYVTLAHGNAHFMIIMLQYWVGHFWTNAKAFWIAVRSRKKKPSYKVTRKTRQDGFYGLMLWPQFLYIILGTVAIVRGLFFLPDINWMTRMSNIAILAFFMYMTSAICLAAFHGMGVPLRRWRRRVAQRLALTPRRAENRSVRESAAD